MIYDILCNADKYPFREALKKAAAFVSTLNENTPTGRHEIDGDRMYANVMEYETCDVVPDKYEVHRRYADLQAVITGSEGVYVRAAAGLPVQTPYDAEKDYAFLAPAGKNTQVKVQLFPGNFVLLFPQDAHMGQGISCEGVCKLKKVVVKIALDSL